VLELTRTALGSDTEHVRVDVDSPIDPDRGAN
jgi:hypothetical protein